MIRIRRYRASYEKDWNSFIETSPNATFLFNRGYMDYHKDRFSDCSLLLYQDKRLIALFPACLPARQTKEKERNIFSHGGLTYGGLIVAPAMNLFLTLSCLYEVVKYFQKHGFTNISYKPVPSFFHTRPFFQDLYGLFLMDSTFTAVNTGFVADLSAAPTVSARRMRMVRKAQKHGITLARAGECKSFWREILTPHLAKRFGTKPVHTETEIEMLRKRFPTNIIQYHAVKDGRTVAGATIFWDRRVAHAQYIASTDLGRKIGALDYLFWRLMTEEFRHARYFSFGTTNMGSPDGRALSRGLVEWKEGFGATMYPYPCYDIETKNYAVLKEYT